MSKNMNKIHVLEYMEIENVLPITETKKKCRIIKDVQIL